MAIINGTSGNDTLSGTAGDDTINGFGGNDLFLVDASVMTALGVSGNFTAGDNRFVANSSGTAQDAEDRIVFNTTTRQIFYDADGSGSAAAVFIPPPQKGAAP